MWGVLLLPSGQSARWDEIKKETEKEIVLKGGGTYPSCMVLKCSTPKNAKQVFEKRSTYELMCHAKKIIRKI